MQEQACRTHATAQATATYRSWRMLTTSYPRRMKAHIFWEKVVGASTNNREQRARSGGQIWDPLRDLSSHRWWPGVQFKDCHANSWAPDIRHPKLIQSLRRTLLLCTPKYICKQPGSLGPWKKRYSCDLETPFVTILTAEARLQVSRGGGPRSLRVDGQPERSLEAGVREVAVGALRHGHPEAEAQGVARPRQRFQAGPPAGPRVQPQQPRYLVVRLACIPRLRGG